MVGQTEKPPDPRWAWAAYEPDADRPWNLARAGHLYRRAAFGASWEQLQQALSDGPQRTVDRLLQPKAEVLNSIALTTSMKLPPARWISCEHGGCGG